MATRQYIGARYVPKFDGEYNASKVYEPLTIVEYNDSSYTSKKTVPAGILPNNTEYWALTGTTSGQILDLQNRMGTAETNINNLDTKIDTKEYNFRNRKFICIGDSYGVPANPDNIPNLESYYDIFAEYAELTPNVNYFKSCRSGAGFAVPSNTFLSLLQNVESLVDADTITDIIVCGGANDAYQTGTDTFNAISTFVNYAKVHFINANIRVGFIGWFNGSTAKDKYQTRLETYKRCVELGAYYLSNIENAFHFSADRQSDGHPNVNGELAIASALFNCLTSNNANVYSYLKSATLTYSDEINTSQSTQNPTIFTAINDTIVSLISNNTIEVALATPKDTNKVTTVNIGTISNTYITGSSFNETSFSIPVELYGTVSGADDTIIGYANVTISDSNISAVVFASTRITLKSVKFRRFSETFMTMYS